MKFGGTGMESPNAQESMEDQREQTPPTRKKTRWYQNRTEKCPRCKVGSVWMAQYPSKYCSPGCHDAAEKEHAAKFKMVSCMGAGCSTPLRVSVEQHKYFCGSPCKRSRRAKRGRWKKRKCNYSNESYTSKYSTSKEFYASPEWRTLRYQAIKKGRQVCEVCFRKGGLGLTLHVDHIKPRSKYPEFELDINNLQLLCEDCNLGKGNRDCIDWRPQVAPLETKVRGGELFPSLSLTAEEAWEAPTPSSAVPTYPILPATP